MKLLNQIVLLIALFSVVTSAAQKIVVDSDGVMRRADNGDEVSFYGVNYTVPFAYSYRELARKGVDRKEAIDHDVYHFARLGFNAFRLHLWDVELTDSVGTLQENEHLDLLDYLIYRLKQRGISIVITAQANFGNGYPELNQPTGGYSYLYEKCHVHDTPSAVSAQERYIKALIKHQNPYTGLSLADDDSVIAIEVNNEPCHSGNEKDVCRYVNRMVKAIKTAGFKKPIFYNVSHNLQVTQGFYDANIDGTTYQWYPIGLVANHERKGNFLPYVDNYNIPFSDVKGFENKAKMVYEFDPADNMYTYLYPAMTRTFRKCGFQWITQFSYDPIDIAMYNTEYPTHYMNLAYTPQKALAMKIAGEVARSVKRGEDFGAYPNDTIFCAFSVSHRQNLALLNNGEKYFYTNNTSVKPLDIDKLKEVAGWGSSPIVEYSGTGAYFLDKVNDAMWRLEVMPDVQLLRDPFNHPSPNRVVAGVMWNKETITVKLPSLGNDFYFKGISDGMDCNGKASDGKFDVIPGVYLLSVEENPSIDKNFSLGSFSLSEYVAPINTDLPMTIVHHPQAIAFEGGNIEIKARVASEIAPDSVMVYPKGISMWADNNVIYKMQRTATNDYVCNIGINKKGCFSYQIVAFSNGKAVTYPGAIEGTPLDWDFSGDDYYSIEVRRDKDALPLVTPSNDIDTEVWALDESSWISIDYDNPPTPTSLSSYTVRLKGNGRGVIKRYVGDLTRELAGKSYHTLCVAIKEMVGVKNIDVAVVTIDGATYSACLDSKTSTFQIRDLRPSPTVLCPAPYPTFLEREVAVNIDRPLTVNEIDYVELHFEADTVDASLQFYGIWIE